MLIAIGFGQMVHPKNVGLAVHNLLTYVNAIAWFDGEVRQDDRSAAHALVMVVATWEIEDIFF